MNSSRVATRRRSAAYRRGTSAHEVAFASKYAYVDAISRQRNSKSFSKSSFAALSGVARSAPATARAVAKMCLTRGFSPKRELVPPPRPVHVAGRRGGDVAGHHLQPLLEGEGPDPAVRLAGPVGDRSAPGRRRRRLQVVVEKMNRVVQVVGVHVAGPDVDLAGELRTDLLPVLL